MPLTEKFAEQRLAIIKHLQNELFTLVATDEMSDSEEQEVKLQMREVAQALLVALGLEVTGESDGVIQANIILSELGEE
jgi:hypothetical protein